MFSSGLSVNTRLLNCPGLALWGREVLEEEDGMQMWFFEGREQLFEDRKSLRDVGPVHLIMMTLDPITPESGSGRPCPTI